MKYTGFVNEEDEREEYIKLIDRLKTKANNLRSDLEYITNVMNHGKDFEKIIKLVNEVNEVKERWEEYAMVLRLTGYDRKVQKVDTPKKYDFYMSDKNLHEYVLKKYADEVAFLNNECNILRQKISDLTGRIFDQSQFWSAKPNEKTTQYEKYVNITYHFSILLAPIFEHEMCQEKWDELMVVLREHGYDGVDGYSLNIT